MLNGKVLGTILDGGGKLWAIPQEELPKSQDWPNLMGKLVTGEFSQILLSGFRQNWARNIIAEYYTHRHSVSLAWKTAKECFVRRG